MGADYNSHASHCPMPDRIKRLAVSREGWPTPWFVGWIDGNPHFPSADPAKLVRAVHERRCWVCGDRLGRNLAFVIGPMCVINRVTSEPPSHLECAEYSVRACPFLSRPRMRRVPVDRQLIDPVPGHHLDRNPGVTCIYVTRTYKPFRTHVGNDGVLFSLGDPSRTTWFTEGRPATRDEVLASIDGGYPVLQKLAEDDGADAISALARNRESAMPLLPSM
jgi:hypothetical protein